MIGHTVLSNSFSVLARPVGVDHTTSSPHDAPQGYNGQGHTPSSSVLGDGNNASEDADARGSSKEAQELNIKIEKQALAQEQDVISQLAARDREVRAHEQAHAAVGGQYAGSPTYSFQRGPDGVRYAVGGEVSIDTSKAATPEETIRKAQVVRQAALAPAEPSPQDRRVAAEASQIQAEAVLELRTQQVEEEKQEREIKPDSNDSINEDVSGTDEDSRQAGLLLSDNASITHTSSDKTFDDKISNTDSTSTRNNIIGSRIYQSIASLAISHRDSHSILDQII